MTPETKPASEAKLVSMNVTNCRRFLETFYKGGAHQIPTPIKHLFDKMDEMQAAEQDEKTKDAIGAAFFLSGFTKFAKDFTNQQSFTPPSHILELMGVTPPTEAHIAYIVGVTLGVLLAQTSATTDVVEAIAILEKADEARKNVTPITAARKAQG